MTTDCKHPRIQTWRFEDSAEVAGLWSCADCGRRFEPVALVVDHACTTSAVVDRVPLTDGQVDKLLDRERMKWKTSPPTHEFAAAFARAIEAAHGITAAGN
jgi:hypothetical protein